MASKDIIPRSVFPRFPTFGFRSFFPSFWDDLRDQMGQLTTFGEESEISVSEDDKYVYVEANVPGLNQSDLDVSIHQNTLLIRGEKKEEEKDEKKKYYRRAKRAFFYQVDLPSVVDENPEKADYQDGVLKITFRKASQAQVKKITIKGNGSQAPTKTKKQ